MHPGTKLAFLLAAPAVALTLLALSIGGARAEGTLAGVDVTVVKSASCDCCGGWIAELRARGARVTAVDTDDLVAEKRARGVPTSMWSCHTAELAGYVVEGHVPLAALERLLEERPAVDGIGLGGMPAGSPGMSGVQEAPFEVMALRGGETSLFGRY